MVLVAGVTYHIVAVQQDGRWTARARREDTGRPFGIECTGVSEGEAVDRLTRWLDWQGAHAEALEALQAAEHAYHRTIAGHAFANPASATDSAAERKQALEALEAARINLDGVRARRPEPHQ